MGMKPRKRPEKPEPVSGWDAVGMGLESWVVKRVLHPAHKTKDFRMAIVSGKYQRVTRGPSKGRQRMTLVVEYVDDTDDSWKG